MSKGRAKRRSARERMIESIDKEIDAAKQSIKDNEALRATFEKFSDEQYNAFFTKATSTMTKSTANAPAKSAGDHEEALHAALKRKKGKVSRGDASKLLKAIDAGASFPETIKALVEAGRVKKHPNKAAPAHPHYSAQ